MTDMISILGLKAEDPKIKSFIAQFSDPPEKESIEDRTYWEFKSKGLALVFDGEYRLISAQIHPGGREGFSPFTDPLPARLLFSDRKTELDAKLGNPIKSGGGTKLPVLGIAPKWDLYEFSDHTLHVEYTEQGAIAMLSVSVK